MTVPGANRSEDSYLTVQCRPRRDKTVLAWLVVMPTSLGTVAFRTVVGGGAMVVGGGGEVVAAAVDAVAAAGVAASPHPESSPAASSSAPMPPATTKNPLR
jgi:hypothetical protein